VYKPKALHVVVDRSSDRPSPGVIQVMTGKQVKARRRLLTWHISVLP